MIIKIVYKNSPTFEKEKKCKITVLKIEKKFLTLKRQNEKK